MKGDARSLDEGSHHTEVQEAHWPSSKLVQPCSPIYRAVCLHWDLAVPTPCEGIGMIEARYPTDDEAASHRRFGFGDLHVRLGVQGSGFRFGVQGF